MKGINLEITDFKNDIINYINESNLPIIIKRDVVAQIVNELASATEKIIRDEKQKYEEELKEKEEEDVNENK